ncbi:endolytic transglycosylase MltG [Klenkia sp. LSe6-5]|uniref:Endolytic murein transglycosylase n=1 Tax=Klenkia sesuvii TaxID=3103137 RepID=A0ABU8DR23_9ACTN
MSDERRYPGDGADSTGGGRRRAREGDGEGRSASDFLAAWHTGEFPAVQDDPTGPLTGGRRARRIAAEEAARAESPAPPAPDDDATVRTPLVPGAQPPARGPQVPPVAPPATPRPPASALSGLVLGTTGENPAVRAGRGVPAESTPRADDGHDEHDGYEDAYDDAYGHDGHDGHDGHGYDDHHGDDHHGDDRGGHGYEDAGDHDRYPESGELPVGRPVTGEHPAWDQTGGLEVIGADVEDERGRRGRRRGVSGERPRRRKRRPVTVVVSLLVLAGLVVGIVFGGQWLLEKVNPTAADYTGSGSGEVQIRVEDGDSLTAIANTLVADDVVASTRPFLDAAAANPAAAGIQPGVYSMALQMSGQAALDRLLDPASRLFARVTLPEGLRVDAALQRIADDSEIPLADLQAAATDPAALGLPAWANGLLEGHLFPATYDIQPGETAVQVLSTMVARAEQTFDELQIPEADRQRVLTEASLVQAEAATTEDMSKVATVIDNRVAIGQALQFDTTVNYATGKTGITTTAEDRAIDSPYNTYLYPGLPPGAINSPGEEALQAVLNPTPGPWLYFVVVDPDTGDTRFAATLEEHYANVALFQQWLRENSGD